MTVSEIFIEIFSTYRSFLTSTTYSTSDLMRSGGVNALGDVLVHVLILYVYLLLSRFGS